MVRLFIQPVKAIACMAESHTRVLVPVAIALLPKQWPANASKTVVDDGLSTWATIYPHERLT